MRTHWDNPPIPAGEDEGDGEDEFGDEDDPEALPVRAKTPGAEVVFHILYSDMYRVPVLYLLPNTPTARPWNMLGASVSQGEHLVTGEACE